VSTAAAAATVAVVVEPCLPQHVYDPASPHYCTPTATPRDGCKLGVCVAGLCYETERMLRPGCDRKDDAGPADRPRRPPASPPPAPRTPPAATQFAAFALPAGQIAFDVACVLEFSGVEWSEFLLDGGAQAAVEGSVFDLAVSVSPSGSAALTSVHLLLASAGDTATSTRVQLKLVRKAGGFLSSRASAEATMAAVVKVLADFAGLRIKLGLQVQLQGITLARIVVPPRGMVGAGVPATAAAAATTHAPAARGAGATPKTASTSRAPRAASPGGVDGLALGAGVVLALLLLCGCAGGLELARRGECGEMLHDKMAFVRRGATMDDVVLHGMYSSSSAEEGQGARSL